MKGRLIIPAIIFSLLLSGCSWMDGSYLSITPHREQNTGIQLRERTATNYLELRNAMVACRGFQ